MHSSAALQKSQGNGWWSPSGVRKSAMPETGERPHSKTPTVVPQLHAHMLLGVSIEIHVQQFQPTKYQACSKQQKMTAAYTVDTEGKSASLTAHLKYSHWYA